MEIPDPAGVTRLLLLWSAGNRSALDELTPLVYRELRRIAGAYLRGERSDHTLQPTALVHEAYLKLVDQTHVQWQNRAQFFAIAATVIRRILVNHAEHVNAAKRGGGHKVALDEAAGLGMGREPELDVIALNQALKKLASLDERQSRIVELRFFAGLTEEEIAEVMGLSAITIKREWRTAKAMLLNELRGSA